MYAELREGEREEATRTGESEMKKKENAEKFIDVNILYFVNWKNFFNRDTNKMRR